jgi:hypothetical protein
MSPFSGDSDSKATANNADTPHHQESKCIFLNPRMAHGWQCDYANQAEVQVDITAHIVGVHNGKHLNSG